MLQHKFFTAKEVAELLKLNLITVYEYIRSGELKAIAFGRNYRISELDLERFILLHRIDNISTRRALGTMPGTVEDHKHAA